MKCIFVVTLFAQCVFADYGGHDLFTSLSQLHELWKNELTVVEDMKVILGALDPIRDSLEK